MDIEALLGTIPTPGPDEMDRRRKFARRYALVFLRRGPAPRPMKLFISSTFST